MKAREPRQTIRVTARLKTPSGWQDVAIQNASAHGMKIAVNQTMRRGEVVEIRRASQVIVARVVWAQGSSYGLRTQDKIDIPALVNPNAAKAEAAVASFQADRRNVSRAGEKAERSRAFAARFQWIAVAGAVIVAVGYTAMTVFEVLGAPLADVANALGGGGQPQLRAVD